MLRYRCSGLLFVIATAILLATPSAAFLATPLPFPSTHHRTSPSHIIAPLRSTSSATPSDDDLRRFQSYGEASRRFRRSYFTQSDWYKARADDRFIANLKTIWKSGIVRQLIKEVTVIASIATFIVIYNALCVDGIDVWLGYHFDAPFADRMWDYGAYTPIRLQLPKEPFAWSIPSLGLLLVFRTNTAYKRWDEGRKAWGAIINSCRTCARLGTTWSSRGDATRLADAIWSFPRSLQFHLLGPLEDGASFAMDVRRTLHDQDFADDLIRVRHKPTRALKEITDVLYTKLKFPSLVYQIEAESAVTVLCDSLGACERIFTSPPPVFYSRHTARFLVTWLTLLPFALYEPFENSWNHWGMIPASVVVSYFLLGIEELATQMEEPFSILPMEKMTANIRLSVDEHVEWKRTEDLSAFREQAYWELNLGSNEMR